MSTASSSILESLPAEIKLKILYSMPTINSLRALVHASPGMHALYATSPEHTYTQVTLNALRGKGVNLNLTSIVSVDFEESFFSEYLSEYLRGYKHAIEFPREFQNTLKSIYDQYRAGKDLVSLSFTDCKIISYVSKIFPWQLVPNKDYLGTDDLMKMDENCHLEPSSGSIYATRDLKRSCAFYLGDGINFDCLSNLKGYYMAAEPMSRLVKKTIQEMDARIAAV